MCNIPSILRVPLIYRGSSAPCPPMYTEACALDSKNYPAPPLHTRTANCGGDSAPPPSAPGSGLDSAFGFHSFSFSSLAFPPPPPLLCFPAPLSPRPVLAWPCFSLFPLFRAGSRTPPHPTLSGSSDTLISYSHNVWRARLAEIPSRAEENEEGALCLRGRDASLARGATAIQLRGPLSGDETTFHRNFVT